MVIMNYAKQNYSFQMLHSKYSKEDSFELIQKVLLKEGVQYEMHDSNELLLVANFNEKVWFLNSKLKLTIFTKGGYIYMNVHRVNDQLLPIKPEIEQKIKDILFINNLIVRH